MNVAVYIARRLALLVPQLLLISVVTFVLIRMLPGDPARLQLGPLASDEGVQQLRDQLRLNDGIVEQYLAYLDRLVHGDFGRSWVNGTDVSDDLAARIPATLELIVLGLALVLIVLLPLGMITAARGGGIVTRILKKIAFGYGLLAGALPDFWLGLLLIFLFFTQLGWLPGPEGRIGIGETPPPDLTGMYTIDALIAGDLGLFWHCLTYLLLPVVTLAFVYGGPIFKMTRSAMEGALRSDYTRYAEALGLRRRTVMWYAFLNSAPPVIVMTGIICGYLLGGAVLIEAVFNLNGIGQYAVTAITSADYAPVQAFVLIAALFTILVYLAVDLVFFASDPRVRTRKGKG
jgi:ABC-type dipeptide/oligopeptide/nickel transport system permease component